MERNDPTATELDVDDEDLDAPELDENAERLLTQKNAGDELDADATGGRAGEE